MNLILIGVGGALGAVSRYGIDKLITGIIGQTVLGTFAVNISGSLMLGLIAGIASSRAGARRGCATLCADAGGGAFSL